MKKLLIASFLFLICTASRAQIGVAHLFSKGLSASGVELFLHAGIGVSDWEEISIEAGLNYFQTGNKHIAMAPCLLGYRHNLTTTGAGWYIEPLAGYTFGGTDIQKTDAAGNPLYTPSGSELDQKVAGFTAAMGVGYILPSSVLPLNFGLRYEHVFVSNDPSQNIASFRVSYSVGVARKLAGRSVKLY